MQWLVAIARFVGDPAERPAIGHAYGERLATLGHARGVERRVREYRAQGGQQRLLGRPIEIGRHETKAGKRARNGHRSGHGVIVSRRCTLSNAHGRTPSPVRWFVRRAAWTSRGSATGITPRLAEQSSD